MIPANLNIENPLWDFALKVYPAISTTLLALQAKGARVNQLLAALWCSEIGLTWPGELDPSIETWHQERVLPVRRWRMELKPLLDQQPELEPLYKSYKRVEISSEQIELALLYIWLNQTGQRATQTKEQLLERNLSKVLSSNQVESFDVELTQLLAQIEHIPNIPNMDEGA